MNPDQIRQLAAWLAGTDIDVLELTGPNVDLRLRRDGVTAAPEAPAAAPEPAPRPAAAPLTAKASSVGHFLHAHPLRAAPLVSIGQRVEAGQCLGLLQVGALLLPVVAPAPGIVNALLVAPGTAVGFGTPLVGLSPA